MRLLSKVALFNSLFFVSIIANAAAPKQELPNPITEVTPFIQKDKSAVIIFFKFDCPACRAFHPSLVGWGDSLPKGIAYQFHPAVEAGGGSDISIETLLGMQTFWVAERLGNRNIVADFADDAYSLLQDERAGNNKDRWFDLLLARGFKRKDIVDIWKSELKLSDTRIERQLHYKPKATPTLVICGKWMISPDSANGDTTLFTQLANGLVSRCAENLGIPVK